MDKKRKSDTKSATPVKKVTVKKSESSKKSGKWNKCLVEETVEDDAGLAVNEESSEGPSTSVGRNKKGKRKRATSGSVSRGRGRRAKSARVSSDPEGLNESNKSSARSASQTSGRARASQNRGILRGVYCDDYVQKSDRKKSKDPVIRTSSSSETDSGEKHVSVTKRQRKRKSKNLFSEIDQAGKLIKESESNFRDKIGGPNTYRCMNWNEVVKQVGVETGIGRDKVADKPISGKEFVSMDGKRIGRRDQLLKEYKDDDLDKRKKEILRKAERDKEAAKSSTVLQRVVPAKETSYRKRNIGGVHFPEKTLRAKLPIIKHIEDFITLFNQLGGNKTAEVQKAMRGIPDMTVKAEKAKLRQHLKSCVGMLKSIMTEITRSRFDWVSHLKRYYPINFEGLPRKMIGYPESENSELSVYDIDLSKGSFGCLEYLNDICVKEFNAIDKDPRKSLQPLELFNLARRMKGFQLYQLTIHHLGFMALTRKLEIFSTRIITLPAVYSLEDEGNWMEKVLIPRMDDNINSEIAKLDDDSSGPDNLPDILEDYKEYSQYRQDLFDNPPPKKNDPDEEEKKKARKKALEALEEVNYHTLLCEFICKLYNTKSAFEDAKKDRIPFPRVYGNKSAEGVTEGIPCYFEDKAESDSSPTVFGMKLPLGTYVDVETKDYRSHFDISSNLSTLFKKFSTILELAASLEVSPKDGRCYGPIGHANLMGLLLRSSHPCIGCDPRFTQFWLTMKLFHYDSKRFYLTCVGVCKIDCCPVRWQCVIPHEPFLGRGTVRVYFIRHNVKGRNYMIHPEDAHNANRQQVRGLDVNSVFKTCLASLRKKDAAGKMVVCDESERLWLRSHPMTSPKFCFDEQCVAPHVKQDEEILFPGLKLVDGQVKFVDDYDGEKYAFTDDHDDELFPDIDFTNAEKEIDPDDDQHSEGGSVDFEDFVREENGENMAGEQHGPMAEGITEGENGENIEGEGDGPGNQLVKRAGENGENMAGEEHGPMAERITEGENGENIEGEGDGPGNQLINQDFVDDLAEKEVKDNKECQKRLEMQERTVSDLSPAKSMSHSKEDDSIKISQYSSDGKVKEDYGDIDLEPEISEFSTQNDDNNKIEDNTQSSHNSPDDDNIPPENITIVNISTPPGDRQQQRSQEAINKSPKSTGNIELRSFPSSLSGSSDRTDIIIDVPIGAAISSKSDDSEQKSLPDKSCSLLSSVTPGITLEEGPEEENSGQDDSLTSITDDDDEDDEHLVFSSESSEMQVEETGATDNPPKKKSRKEALDKNGPKGNFDVRFNGPVTVEDEKEHIFDLEQADYSYDHNLRVREKLLLRNLQAGCLFTNEDDLLDSVRNWHPSDPAHNVALEDFLKQLTAKVDSYGQEDVHSCAFDSANLSNRNFAEDDVIVQETQNYVDPEPLAGTLDVLFDTDRSAPRQHLYRSKLWKNQYEKHLDGYPNCASGEFIREHLYSLRGRHDVVHPLVTEDSSLSPFKKEPTQAVKEENILSFSYLDDNINTVYLDLATGKVNDRIQKSVTDYYKKTKKLDYGWKPLKPLSGCKGWSKMKWETKIIKHWQGDVQILILCSVSPHGRLNWVAKRKNGQLDVREFIRCQGYDLSGVHIDMIMAAVYQTQEDFGGLKSMQGFRIRKGRIQNCSKRNKYIQIGEINRKSREGHTEFSHYGLISTEIVDRKIADLHLAIPQNKNECDNQKDDDPKEVVFNVFDFDLKEADFSELAMLACNIVNNQHDDGSITLRRFPLYQTQSLGVGFQCVIHMLNIIYKTYDSRRLFIRDDGDDFAEIRLAIYNAFIHGDFSAVLDCSCLIEQKEEATIADYKHTKIKKNTLQDLLSFQDEYKPICYSDCRMPYFHDKDSVACCICCKPFHIDCIPVDIPIKFKNDLYGETYCEPFNFICNDCVCGDYRMRQPPDPASDYSYRRNMNTLLESTQEEYEKCGILDPQTLLAAVQGALNNQPVPRKFVDSFLCQLTMSHGLVKKEGGSSFLLLTASDTTGLLNANGTHGPISNRNLVNLAYALKQSLIKEDAVMLVVMELEEGQYILGTIYPSTGKITVSDPACRFNKWEDYVIAALVTHNMHFLCELTNNLLKRDGKKQRKWYPCVQSYNPQCNNPYLSAGAVIDWVNCITSGIEPYLDGEMAHRNVILSAVRSIVSFDITPSPSHRFTLLFKPYITSNGYKEKALVKHLRPLPVDGTLAMEPPPYIGEYKAKFS